MLTLAIGLSILFVHMILASQFGSFIQPLAIMRVLPFSVMGGLLTLLAIPIAYSLVNDAGNWMVRRLRRSPLPVDRLCGEPVARRI